VLLLSARGPKYLRQPAAKVIVIAGASSRITPYFSLPLTELRVIDFPLKLKPVVSQLYFSYNS
jgi:hypothetical protein